MTYYSSVGIEKWQRCSPGARATPGCPPRSVACPVSFSASAQDVVALGSVLTIPLPRISSIPRLRNQPILSPLFPAEPGYFRQEPVSKRHPCDNLYLPHHARACYEFDIHDSDIACPRQPKARISWFQELSWTLLPLRPKGGQRLPKAAEGKKIYSFTLSRRALPVAKS